MKFTSPIIIFILASAGIHAGLVITSNTTNIALPGSTGSVMAVKLKEINQITVRPDIKKRRPQKEQSKKTKNTKDNPEKLLAKLSQRKTYQEKTITEKYVQLIESSSIYNQAESKARVISIIYKELSQHFKYPKLAQKRNWQGKVLLSLRVTASGMINNIQLNSSSGYSVLDKAAINSLIKVGHIPQISSWLPYDINLNLPVVYQLTEG